MLYVNILFCNKINIFNTNSTFEKDKTIKIYVYIHAIDRVFLFCFFVIIKNSKAFSKFSQENIVGVNKKKTKTNNKIYPLHLTWKKIGLGLKRFSRKMDEKQFEELNFLNVKTKSISKKRLNKIIKQFKYNCWYVQMILTQIL